MIKTHDKSLLVATCSIVLCSAPHYTYVMTIATFRHKGLARLYRDDVIRGVPPELANKLKRQLLALDEAQAPSNMGLFPGWRLHPLTGNMTGFWSVTVSGNWRLVFRFEDGQAFDVDLVDYH